MSNDASGVARRVLLGSQSISFISSDHKQILGLCEGDCGTFSLEGVVMMMMLPIFWLFSHLFGKDSDEDCGPGLTCFQRDGLQEVPGCSGSTADFSGYDLWVPLLSLQMIILSKMRRSPSISNSCYSHVSTYGPLEFKGENPSLALGPCQGDCCKFHPAHFYSVYHSSQ